MQTSFYTDAVQYFTAGEAKLQTLEQELATGNAVSTASANPAAFIGAAADTDDTGQLAAENDNQTDVQDTLGLGTSALTEAATVLDQIQQIALEAINGTVNGSEYQALSEQVQQNLQQLLAVANTEGNNGNYVFAGTASNTKPFLETASGSVEYIGDEGLSTVEVSPGITINAALSGSPFLSGYSGDGYASVTAAAANTGAATLLAVGVTDESEAAGFQEGSQPITVAFSTTSSGTIEYTATEGSATIASGSAASGQDITLDGIQFALSGTPASGDSFTVSPARPQSVFSLVQTIETALASPGTTSAERAQTTQVLGNALSGITQYQNLFTSANARIGVVLQTVSNAETDNTERSTTDETNAADLTAANTPAVMTSLDEQTTALQAALQAFGMTEGLSVFNYL